MGQNAGQRARKSGQRAQKRKQVLAQRAKRKQVTPEQFAQQSQRTLPRLEFDFPASPEQLAPLERELLAYFGQMDEVQPKFDPQQFFTEEAKLFAKVNPKLAQAINKSLELVAQYDQEAAQTLAPFKMAIAANPLFAINPDFSAWSWQRKIEHMFALGDQVNAQEHAQRRIVLYAQVMLQLNAMETYVLDRYGVLDPSEDPEHYRYRWLKLVADHAYDREHIRIICAYQSLVASEDQTLWAKIKHQEGGFKLLPMFEASFQQSLWYEALMQKKEELLAAAPDRAAAEAQLWFK